MGKAEDVIERRMDWRFSFFSPSTGRRLRSARKRLNFVNLPKLPKLPIRDCGSSGGGVRGVREKDERLLARRYGIAITASVFGKRISVPSGAHHDFHSDDKAQSPKASGGLASAGSIVLRSAQHPPRPGGIWCLPR